MTTNLFDTSMPDLETVRRECPPGWSVENLQNDETRPPLYRFEHRGLEYGFTAAFGTEDDTEEQLYTAWYSTERRYLLKNVSLAEAVSRIIQEMKRLTGFVESRIADAQVEEGAKGGYHAVIRREVVYEESNHFLTEAGAQQWIEKQRAGEGGSGE